MTEIIPGGRPVNSTYYSNQLPRTMGVVQSAPAPTISDEQTLQMAQRAFNTVNQGSNIGRSRMEMIGHSVAGVSLKLADDFMASPINPLHYALDTESGSTTAALGSAELQEFMRDNEAAVEGAAGLAGALVVATIGDKYATKALSAGLASSTAITGSRIWQAGAGWTARSQKAVLLAQREALSSGKAFSMLGSSAGRDFLAAKVATNVGVAARQEALVYGVMWENDAINAEGWQEDAFWITAGMGLGGILGGVQARYTLRKAANSAETRTALSEIYPMGNVANRLTGELDIQRAMAIRPEGRVQEHSATATEFFKAARAVGANGSDVAGGVVGGANNALRAAAKQKGKQAVERILTRRIDGVEVQRGRIADTPELEYLAGTTAAADPFILHGLAEMGMPLRSLPEARRQRASWLAATQEKADALLRGTKHQKEGRELQARLARQKKQEELVLVDGSWISADSPMAAAAVQFDQKAARARIRREEGGNTLTLSLPKLGEVTFDGSLQLRRGSRKAPEGANWAGRKVAYESLSEGDRLHVQEAMRTLVDSMSKDKSKGTFIVNEKSAKDWLALDMANEILNRKGTVNWSHQTIRDQAALQRESLRLKARALLAEAGQLGDITADMRMRFNLPRATAMERLEDPNGMSFRKWLQAAAADGGEAWELSEALGRLREIEGYELMRQSDGASGYGPRLDGDFLNWNRNESGTFMRPMLGYFHPTSALEQLSKRGDEERAMLVTAERTGILIDRTNDSFTARLARTLVQLPEMQTARNVGSLHDSQSTGLGSKAAQLVSEFLPFRNKHRDNAVVLSASRLMEQTTRAADMEFAELMRASGMRDIVTQMKTPGKQAMQVQLDSYASMRPGWDVEEVLEVEPGWYAWQLADTELNRRLSGLDKISNGDFVMDTRTGKPVLVQAEALAAIQQFESITEAIRQSTNTVRKAKGYNQVKRKSFFWPSQDTKHKYVGFTFDINSERVPGYTIVASTEQEYLRLQQRVFDELGDGYTVRSKEQLRDSLDEWEKGAMDWVDVGNSLATPKGQQTGGLNSGYRVGAFQEGLEWVRKQVSAQAHGTLRTLMQDPIELAKMRGAVTRNVSVDRKASRNIFDEWEHALTGNSFNYRDSAIASKAMDGIEAAIDKVLASSGVTVPAHFVMDVARRFGVSPTQLSRKKSYRQIVETMGDRSPFANMEEFLDAQEIRMPPSVKRGAQKLNSIATSVVLRWDPFAAYASMNMLGLIPTLTAGVRAGSAPSSIAMQVKGRNVPFIDSLQILKGGIQDLFSPKKAADWDWMVKHGDASQSAFEYRQVTGSIKSQAGFNKWFDKADKWVSYLSDGSENLSRQMSHMVGLRVADYQGIRGMAARHDFAREFANAAIADYNPANRPEFFQTGFGSVFGLFQSYVMSQYTKMFHWMEQGEYAAAGTQAAWQAALFGTYNTYGIGSLFDLHHQMTGESGEPNLIDAAYNRFGPTLGGALMHGSLSELTQIALWTRGDTNVRIPALNGGMPAGVDVMTRVANMITGVVSQTLNQGPVDGLPAMIEIVQREMPNRVLKGVLAVTMLDGKETDRYGAVMTDTRTWLDSVARVAGLRSRRTQVELEAFYASKTDMDRDAARQDKVRQRLRTDMRAAERAGVSVDPAKYFDDYVAAGGNPRRFRTFFRQAMEDATSPRAAKQLKKSLETPRNNLATWRYGAYGAFGIDDGTTQAVGP